MKSFFLLKRGVQILYLFNQNQTPRSDSANLDPSEPMFRPRILEPRYITEDRRHASKAAEIMDAWSSVLTEPVFAADGQEAAWSGTGWARAAEIIRHTAPEGVWPVQPNTVLVFVLFAPYSVWRALLMPQVNPGSRYRCGKSD